MLPKYTLPVLAILGFSFATYSTVNGNQPAPVAPPVAEPAHAPFPAFIAGSGIIEAQSRNIAIGTPLSGIVKSISVKIGDQAQAGSVLFSLDDREARAELAVKQADLAKARAGVAEAETEHKNAKTLLALAENISDPRAISQDELERRRNALTSAQSKIATAQAQVLQAEAAVASVKTTLERLVVRAPVDGEVLQVNIRPGEFASSGVLSLPLILLGDLQQLHVRVDIDENDAWRFQKNGKAVAFLRGNRDFSTDLNLAWVEPYVLPKRSLTGDSIERVDTRVLQVVYRFARDKLPVYVGQQMDVFIEVPDANRPPL
jgi:multidrug efflux pump subunit AcrA (membrane-fusion protein)